MEEGDLVEDEGHILRKNKVALDSSRVIRHPIDLSKKVKLSLKGFNNDLAAILDIEDFESVTVKVWLDYDKAEKEYAKMLEKIQKGEYELHVYDNGKIKLKLK